MNSIRKEFDALVELKDGSRLVTAVISTDSVDRDGEIVLPSGMIRKQYSGNPVVLWTHDQKSLPIGKCNGIRPTQRQLIAQYYVSDKTQAARDVFGLLQDGVLRAHSINLMPLVSSPPTAAELVARPDWEGARLIHRQWELLEFSVCAVPCNPDCLALAVAKCSPETRAALGKAWEPEEDCCEWGGFLVPEEFVKALEDMPPVMHGRTVPILPPSDERLQPEPKALPEPKPIATPAHCLSLADALRQRLADVVSKSATAEDFIRRITGKA